MLCRLYTTDGAIQDVYVDTRVHGAIGAAIGLGRTRLVVKKNLLQVNGDMEGGNAYVYVRLHMDHDPRDRVPVPPHNPSDPTILGNFLLVVTAEHDHPADGTVIIDIDYTEALSAEEADDMVKRGTKLSLTGAARQTLIAIMKRAASARRDG